MTSCGPATAVISASRRNTETDSTMLLDATLLKGRLARRILGMFVISALVPVLVLAILYRFQGNALLLEQAQTELGAASATYSSVLYDRLLLADDALRKAAAELSQGVTTDNVRKNTATPFRNLEVSKGKPIPDYESALTPEAQAHIASGGTALVSISTSENESTILILRTLDPMNPGKALVSAEIRPQYLWADRDTVAYLTELCVFDQNGRRLSCSQTLNLPTLADLLARNAQGSSGGLEWQDEDGQFVGDYREVFLDAKFAVPRWIVVAAQRRADAFDTLATFETVFWTGLIVSVLLATLLSISQIRRVMVPLAKLISGTSRLSQQDFSTKVEIASNDEFETLARSFNMMTARLGRQFDVMKTLSAIDQAILRNLAVDRIIEEILVSLQDLFDVECAGIVAMDRVNPTRLRLYAINRDRSQGMLKQLHATVDADDLLLTNTDGYWTNADNASWQEKACKQGSAAQRFYNLPIASKTGHGGLVILGFANHTTLAPDEVSNVRDFADRIGVALTSAARDEQLFRQARYDSLTGLPNRFLLVERLKREIAQSTRSGTHTAIIYIDLDRFKQVNDSLGHTAGDQLLQEASDRLQSCVRETDTLARVGGDEFAIVVGGLDDAKAASAVADHVLSTMENPFAILGVENFVGASIGIAVFPEDGTESAELLRNADTAMYRAKSVGRSTSVFFESNMNAEVVRIARLDRELRHAVSEQQLLVHYQPQFDLKTGAICAAEALLRWEHPTRGVLMPGTFIDFAEDSGLIVSLGHFVLQEACRRFSGWRAAGIDLGHISVNVSGRQFRHREFLESVEAVLQETGVPGNCLAIEVTENVLIEDVDQVIESLNKLRALGIRIELDDFGTGYSSMSYLERLPIDALKIDRSFVAAIDAAGRGGVIAKLVLDMARSLNMSVVAEGMETQTQLEFMRKHNCDLGQGFLFSEPLPAAFLTTFFSRWNLLQRKALFPDAISGKGTVTKILET